MAINFCLFDLTKKIVKIIIPLYLCAPSVDQDCEMPEWHHRVTWTCARYQALEYDNFDSLRVQSSLELYHPDNLKTKINKKMWSQFSDNKQKSWKLSKWTKTKRAQQFFLSHTSFTL